MISANFVISLHFGGISDHSSSSMIVRGETEKSRECVFFFFWLCVFEFFLFFVCLGIALVLRLGLGCGGLFWRGFGFLGRVFC